MARPVNAAFDPFKLWKFFSTDIVSWRDYVKKWLIEIWMGCKNLKFQKLFKINNKID